MAIQDWEFEPQNKLEAIHSALVAAASIEICKIGMSRWGQMFMSQYVPKDLTYDESYAYDLMSRAHLCAWLLWERRQDAEACSSTED